MEEKNTNLPASIQGDGRKFIFLLKDYLKDLQDKILEQYNYVNSIFNATADNPDVIEEQVHSITVDEKNVNGSISLTLKWNSDDIKNYAGVVIDVKEGAGRGFMDWKNTEWTRHYTTAKTNTFVIENCVPDHIYYIRIRAKDIVNALSRESTAPFLTHYIEADSYAPRPPYEFSVVFDERGAYWSWKQYDQNKYLWTELRLDMNVGEEHNRLDITTDLWSDKVPTVRTGTAYLYNRGFGNSYSAPAILEFTKGVPRAPTNVKAIKKFGGILITFDTIPSDCLGAHVYINNELHKVTTNEFLYLVVVGRHTIKVAYVDAFGEGEMSAPITIDITTEIDPAWLKRASITLDKVDTEINNLLSQAASSFEGVTVINGKLIDMQKATDKSIADLNQSLLNKENDINNKISLANKNINIANENITTANNKIIDIVGALNGNKDKYSSFTMLNNLIDLKVTDGNIISRINASKEGIQIDSNKIKIDGDTYIIGKIIQGKHIGDKTIATLQIADGAINAEKIAVNAVTASKINANAVTAEKIDSEAVQTKHMKVNSIDGDRIISSTLQGDKIIANSITGDKLVAGAVTGDKIMSNTITASHLKAGTIDLNYTGVGISGGGVFLDSTGMAVRDSDKSYTKFGANGIVWYDTRGNGFGSVRRMVKGEAQHGDYITLNWDKEPFVMVTPTWHVRYEDPGTPRVYTRAVDISKNGFRIEAYMSQPWVIATWTPQKIIRVWSSTGTTMKFRANANTKVLIDGVKEVTGHGFTGSHTERDTYLG